MSDELRMPSDYYYCENPHVVDLLQSKQFNWLIPKGLGFQVINVIEIT